ncbi:DUF4129 domain-containing protein [Actinoplanes sp. NBC_00393]|uniref:DUF4129 domain-containing protein n=1 Tax=Actinoplanes sp. NBC_00393 TaxID=2975953 RepID=UPI002E1BF18F
MRAYDEFVADVFDVVPPQLLLLLLIVVTMLTAVLWYTYPAWIPRRFPRFRLPKLRWRFRRRKRTKREKTPVVVVPPSTPAVVAAAVADPGLADRLAAEGRYAEAIRQRLRDTVTDLTRAGVVAPQPGWTAAELSAVAAANQPPLGPALDGATDLFSQVWYGRRQAGADQDARMRRLTAQVRDALS